MSPLQTKNQKVGQGQKITSRNIWYIAAAALLVLVPTMLEFGFVLPRSRYVVFLLCIMSIYVIATSGLDVLFGYTGQISLGHAGFYAIGAYVSVLLSHDSFGISQWLGFRLPPIISIFFASFVAMGFGILLAIPAAKLVFHFLALLTIAFGQLAFLAISSFPGVTNGYLGITSIPPIRLFGIDFDTNYKFYLLSLVFAGVVLLAKNNIIKSRVGRCFIAIRENQLAANGAGIDVTYYKIVAFAISAFFTGLSGALYAHLIGFISPESFMYAQSVIFLTMLVFGGNGNLIGPILGAVVITITQEALQSLKNYQMLIYGVFLLVTILFLPKGLYGLSGICRDAVRKAVKRNDANA